MSYWKCDECSEEFNLEDKLIAAWNKQGCCDECADDLGVDEDDPIGELGELRAGSLGDVAGDD